MQAGQQHPSAGFTLIELMIVVAIIAIIAAIAYPSYRHSVMKSDRSDAKVALATTAQAMERCFTQYNSYTDSHCPSFPATSPQGFYTITAPASATTSTTFELAAVPAATSSQKDDHQCQKFTLDNTGQRTAKNQSGADTTAECW